MRTFVVRNFFLAGLTLLPLAGIAHAQGENVNTMADKQDAAERKAAKDYMEKRELDEKYKATLQNLQAPAVSNDPWGNVRPAATPAKPAAKPAAVKSASGTGKPAAGSDKPAIGSAAPANPANQKGQ
jgi:hypothetical protein